MRAVLLDGSVAGDHAGERIRNATAASLRAQGWDVEQVTLRDKTIGNCAGDFFCWIRSPGTCNVDDDNRAIAEALANAGLMVYLTPVTFGGYSSTLKRIVDHQIQNVSPFFIKVDGETHHEQRYRSNPDLLAVGWTDTPDERGEAIFRHLARRNAVNLHAKTCVSAVVRPDVPDSTLAQSIEGWLDDLSAQRSSSGIDLPTSPPGAFEAAEVKNALLLVGSPRTRASTSNSLGAYVFERLHERSVRCETMYPHTMLRSAAKTAALLEAVDTADLVVLAFPLYVDSLPAPIVETLERIAAQRRGRGSLNDGQRFAAISNSGFPEADQSATALAICETFARDAGFTWAGSLALGGGQMLDGAPLTGGRTARIRRALDIAADALVQGQAVPDEARELLAKPTVPHWLYRKMGWFGWRWQARRYGAQGALKRRPYQLDA